MLSKTSISNVKTYQELGKYWDEHDATEFGWQSEIEFNVNIRSQHRYYSLDKQLSQKLKSIARIRGISEEALLNLWVQEKISQFGETNYR